MDGLEEESMKEKVENKEDLALLCVTIASQLRHNVNKLQIITLKYFLSDAFCVSFLKTTIDCP